MPENVTQFISPERQRKIAEAFDRREAAAIRAGEHLWIVTVCYFVTPPLRDGQLLDVENMAMHPVLGCYLCEQVYDERLAKRRCRPRGIRR